MPFPFNFFAAAFVGALLTSALALPLWRRWCLRTGLVDEPGDRKVHVGSIPLAGGLAVLTGILLPLALGALGIKLGVVNVSSVHLVAHGLERRGIELVGIAIGAGALTLPRLIDDRHELKALPKLAGQFGVALLVAASGLRITLFVHNEIFSYVITALWLVTVINAFNFIDNMNGLCGGLGAIGAILFAIIAAVHGEYLVAIMAFLMAGALIGFLPYNFPKARAFLGDSGSHLVGYLLAVMAILPHFYNRQNPHPLAVLSPLLVLAVPLGDLAQVVLFRSLKGKPFWIGDTNHLSHWLTRQNLSRTHSVLLIWLIAVMIGILATL